MIDWHLGRVSYQFNFASYESWLTTLVHLSNKTTSCFWYYLFSWDVCHPFTMGPLSINTIIHQFYSPISPIIIEFDAVNAFSPRWISFCFLTVLWSQFCEKSYLDVCTPNGVNWLFFGWIQTLLREIVKSQSFGYPTSHSKSSSKIVPACEIWVHRCMCKCLFLPKVFEIVLMGKLLQKWANPETFYI